jgi:putative transposase
VAAISTVARIRQQALSFVVDCQSNLSVPRQPRYFIPNIPQHVIQRGVDKQPVFFQPADYELYLNSLGEAAEKYGCLIHAYVLMTNHTHLLLTPGQKRSLPLLMQAMGRDYVQKLNKTYGRTGTLWEGRYRASLVQDDHYLLACYRYIELNPVRAGLAPAPGDYPYSSYRHNALGKPNHLLSTHSIYRALAEKPDERQTAYRNLFLDSISPEMLATIRNTTNSCLVLGNERFKDQIEVMLGRSVRPGKRGRPKDTGR